MTGADGWTLVAWQGDAGVCVDFAIPGNSPFACGFPVRGAKAAGDASGVGPPVHAVSGFVVGGNLFGGDGKATVFGVAAREVRAVAIELRSGRRVEASVYDAPQALGADLRFFLARLALAPAPLGNDGPVRATSRTPPTAG